MHPALSVIVFTTSSGAGYGLLFLLGLLAPAGVLPADRGFGLAALGLALTAITGGLLSSTLHLGRPERALHAFSQWRSSWLSREGVAAVATYVPAGLFFIGWVLLGATGGVWAAFGILAALGSLAAVVSTGMIYRSLRPIQRWCNPWTVPNYLALALMTGALWLSLLTQLFGIARPTMSWIALLSVVLAAALKLAYWRHIDGTASQSTAESATGLGALGTVRLFEAPHTSENYLLKEMGFRIARKHAAKLRRIALVAGFAVPFVLSAIALATAGLPAMIAALIAAPLASLGTLVERWLFFAEAKHTVTLYYGAARA